jgi:hypothetical protein
MLESQHRNRKSIVRNASCVLKQARNTSRASFLCKNACYYGKMATKEELIDLIKVYVHCSNWFFVSDMAAILRGLTAAFSSACVGKHGISAVSLITDDSG